MPNETSAKVGTFAEKCSSNAERGLVKISSLKVRLGLVEDLPPLKPGLGDEL